MLLSLISTKISLLGLGSEDFGIYSLIAGLVGLLGFLSITMAIGTQRYLSFYLGAGDLQQQKKIFSHSWLLHLVIAVICSGSLVWGSSFLFDNIFNISRDKVDVAEVIYYSMCVSVFFTVLSVPYIAVITTHENMYYLGIVSVMEGLLKLAAAASTYLYAEEDRLLYFGYLVGGISFMSFLAYSIFTLRKYKECQIKIDKIEPVILRKLVGFTGWNLLGSLSRLGKIQGIAVILNMFFGAVINTSVGIANQVSGSLNFLSASFVRALNPQIMSSVGAGDLQRSLRLSLIASKFGYLVLAAFVIPISFEMANILVVWLTVEVPYVAMFSIIMVTSILLEQFTIGILSAFQAIGQIKLLQIGVSITWILTIPLAYILLLNGYPVHYAMLSLVFTEIGATIYRIFLAKRSLGISYQYYIKSVLLKCVPPSIVGCIVSYISLQIFSFEYRFLLTITLSVLFFSVAVYFFSLEEKERSFVNGGIKKIRV